MNIRKLGLILPLLLVMLAGAISSAQAEVRLRGKISNTVRLSNADPAIISITAKSCACQLAVTDTLVMQGVKVKIFNNGTTTAKIKLKLSYFDLALGRTVTGLVGGAQGIAITGRKYRTIRVTSRTILARKSVGVTVEIIPITPDKNLANNKQTVRRCDTYIVE